MSNNGPGDPYGQQGGHEYDPSQQQGGPQYGQPEGAPQYGAPQYGSGQAGYGAAPQMNDPAMQGTPPSNNLVWGILTTLFCCLPFGIVSIVFAAKVNGLWAGGDHVGARDASEKAKKWAIIAAVVGVPANIILVWAQYAAQS